MDNNMTTTKDILDVCSVQLIKDENIGWKRTLLIKDTNGSEYRAILIWDSYDGYEFIPLNVGPLSDGMVDLIMQDDFEPILDEITSELESHE